jgi:hypothetical protein
LRINFSLSSAARAPSAIVGVGGRDSDGDDVED